MNDFAGAPVVRWHQPPRYDRLQRGIGSLLVPFCRDQRQRQVEPLPRLVRYALDRGLQVYVYSNLVRITPELWDLFSQPGVFLGTSWYSAGPRKHAQITGNEASYAHTRANIAEAVRRGIRVRAAVVKTTADQDVEQAVAELRRLGVTDFRIRPAQGIGRAANDNSRQDVAQLCGNCGIDRAAILPDGQLSPCAMARWLNCGNVRDASLAQVLSGPAWQHTLTLVPRHAAVRACAPDNCPPASDGNDCPPASCR